MEFLEVVRMLSGLMWVAVAAIAFLTVYVIYLVVRGDDHPDKKKLYLSESPYLDPLNEKTAFNGAAERFKIKGMNTITVSPELEDLRREHEFLKREHKEYEERVAMLEDDLAQTKAAYSLQEAAAERWRQKCIETGA